MLLISKGTAFTLCVSQVALTGGVIMYFPPVRVQLYSNHPSVVNGTLSSGCARSTVNFSLSLPFLAISCLAVLFSTTTAGLTEGGVLQQDNHYSFELLSEISAWDTIFWIFCGAVHALVFIVVMSPADLYAVCLASLLVFYFLGRICAPRCSQINMTQENANLLGFCAGLIVAIYNVPDEHSGRGAAIFVTLLLDYMLCVGHTWDSMPPMDTISNCRLFWVCSACLCLAGLYAAWHDHLLLE